MMSAQEDITAVYAQASGYEGGKPNTQTLIYKLVCMSLKMNLESLFCVVFETIKNFRSLFLKT